jgi:site-specific DNA-adenine methylase
MKAPFPYFGGKSRVAAEVWAAFGDVDNYAEPFAGSLAVLLERPTWHSGYTETVNDADQYLANFWRALAADPDAVAHYADWPVNEADLFARHLWLVNEGKRRMVAGMEADPEWYDAKIAGWWLWGICAWIGSGWCNGDGPHDYASLAVEGNAGQGVNRKLPFLAGGSSGGQKIHAHNWNGNGDLYAYMHALAARLRRVRVCCGDWSRIVTHGALNFGDTVGIFLDPPYADTAERTDKLYSTDDLDVAHEVRAWAIANGDNPRYRIALCGYEGEHVMPASWRVHVYRANKAYGSSNGGGLNDANRRKERIWFSPHCLTVQPSLFDHA